MVRRGEIWLVDFGDPVGHEQGYRRPALVVSVDRFNRSRAGLAVVLPLTTTRRGLPSHIEIDADHTGLDATSYAKTEDIKSVAVERLVHRIGIAPVEALNGAEHALRLLLGL